MEQVLGSLPQLTSAVAAGDLRWRWMCCTQVLMTPLILAQDQETHKDKAAVHFQVLK